MQNLLKKLMPLISLAILIGTGCRKQDQIIPHQNTTDLSSEAQNGAGRFDSYVTQSWYNLMMKLIKETPGHTPPVAARSFGYTGVTLYESLAGEMPNHHSLVGQLSGLTSIPQRDYGNSFIAPIIANAALAKIIRALFQNASAANPGSSIDSLESVNEKLYTEHFSEKMIARSRDYGRAVADAVFNWSLTDGGNQAYLNIFPIDYIPPVGIDKWIATAPGQLAMLPYWGNNRTMVSANNAGAVDPLNPPAFSASPGSPFFNAAYEVYNTGSHLSGEQNLIALYWADGGGTSTPPGHNLAITLQMIRNYHLNLIEAAILLAKIGIAENDAAVVCWRAKFKTNLLRPVTFMQAYIDAAWMPLIPTPPFPTYTSGHSTFSGAAAAILTAEIGDQISFTDSTKIAYGFSPRSFNSFIEAAQEAAISRLYGGIHYRFDNDEGYKCGQLVAMNVENLNW